MTVESMPYDEPAPEDVTDDAEEEQDDPIAEYWAAAPQYSDAFVTNVLDRVKSFYTKLDRRGLITRYHKAYAAYHGLSRAYASDPGATMQVQSTGLDDQFCVLEANHYRNLILHQLNLATSGRPAFDCRALNNDHRSAAQTKVARDAIDHYRREQGVERTLRKTAEISLVFGESFLHQFWDVHAMLEGPTGPIAGDIQHGALNPLDVPRQLAKDGRDSWRCVRDHMSKYDLAAAYPKLADKLLKVGPPLDEWHRYRIGFDPQEAPDDEITVYYFYHGRTKALPAGRAAILAGDVCVYDGPLPYDDLPVIRMAPTDFLDQELGYASSWDLLGPAELFNGCLSAITTRVSAFGVNNVLMEDGGEVDVDQLGGMNVIRYPRQTRPPEALELLVIPDTLLKTLEMANQMMQTLSGINSVARGDPDANIKSGAAMALVQAMALQFNSGLQAAWVDLLERFGTGLVRILKRFVEEPRMIAITGESGRWNLQEFKGQDIAQIDRVFIDVGNPLARTTAGRTEIARDLLQNQLIKDPTQYFAVLTTGRLEPIYDGPSAIVEGIKAENEALGRGENPPVLMFERHDKHFNEHLALLNTPEAKANEAVKNALQQHLSEHLKIWMELTIQSPHILAITGTPPLPIPMMGPPGAGAGAGPSAGPGAPPQGEKPPPGGPDKGGPGPDGNAPPPKRGTEPGGLPGMPSQPTNPLTGEKPDVPSSQYVP